MVHDIQKYKEAKKILPHLEMIIKIISLTETTLVPFSNYIPVTKILIVIKEQKLVIESYRDSFKNITSNKAIRK